MVRVLDAATQAAVRDRSQVVPVNFVLLTVKDGNGDDVLFGFTDYGEDVQLNIVDGETGNTVSRTYYGDEAPIVEIDPMPLKIGLEVDTTNVVLNPLHAFVEDMARSYTARNGPVQIHRGWLDPGSSLLVAAPRIRRLGFINEMPIETAGAGGESHLVLKVVSNTRELTRTNPAKRSDAQQRLRSGDRFRKYNDVAADWEIWWGERPRKERKKDRRKR